MTQDAGMDCQPSWQDVKADRDFFQSELNCLRESHYLLREIEFDLRAERDAMERRARTYEEGAKKLQAERDALAAHVEAGKRIVREWGRGEFGDVAAALQLDQWASTKPTISLARLKAEWQAEALEKAANYLQHGEGKDSVNPPVSLRGLAIRLRSKIEENDHDER